MKAISAVILLMAELPAFPYSAPAQDQSAIHLKHGIYVVSGTKCKDAPFAAMSIWDGVGFGGPHESQCKTKILHRHGHMFDISTTCSALGDGTPTTPSSSSERLIVFGSETFSARSLTGAEKPRASADAVTYRWCSAK